MVSFIATTAAIISLFLSWYRDFIHKPKLKSVINQIVFLPPPRDIQSKISLEILADVLIGNKMPEVLNRLPNIGQFMDGNDNSKEDILNRIDKWMKSLPPSMAVDLRLPDEIVGEYYNHSLYQQLIYLPLNIYNKGKAFGEISDIILIIKDKENTERVWVFQGILEIKESEIIKHTFSQPELDYFDKLFPGLSVKPNDSIRCDLLFTPVQELKGFNLNIGNLYPGTFSSVLIGYNQFSKKVLETTNFDFTYNKENFTRLFSGTKLIRKGEATDKSMLKELNLSHINFMRYLKRGG